jgi:ABC-2 type transport system ATP-binding protein
MDESMPEAAVVAVNLAKQYNHLKAVDGISFEVQENEIFGFLGPNGAGKTTTIKCITTLIRPSSGRIEVFGVNVAQDPDKVRQNIGYVPQSLSLVNDVSGYENLLFSAKLYGVQSSVRRERIGRMLELLGMKDRANDVVRKYSGGMMRRLEIGTALVHQPRLLVLDEPTIGLDPQGRRVVWELLRRLVKEFGITVFMTTHDMSEADELCQRIAIIHHGKIVAIGTPAELKRSVGGDIIVLETKQDPATAAKVLEGEQGIQISAVGENSLSVIVESAERYVPEIIGSLSSNRIQVEAIFAQKPTLDDVFLKYAGSRLEAEEAGGDWRQIRQVRRTFRKMG